MAIFFYGFFVGHYNKFNMSLDGIRQIGLVLNVFYVAAEAFCFIYLGLSFENALDSKKYNLLIAIVVILIALGCRFFCLMVVAYFKR